MPLNQKLNVETSVYSSTVFDGQTLEMSNLLAQEPLRQTVYEQRAVQLYSECSQ